MIISYCWLFVKIKLNNSKKIYFFALVLVIVYTDNGDAGKMYAAANAAQDENGQQRNKREKGRRREKTAKEKTAKEKTAKEKTAPRLLCRGAVFLLIRCRRRPAAQGCSTGLRTGLRYRPAARRCGAGCARPYRACSISEGYIVPSFITKEHSESASSSWSRSRCQPAKSASLPG